MTALRCTQKLLAAMKVTPAVPPAAGKNRLGDWMLNLIHTRPKMVVAISEHDRLGLALEAAPFTTLPQRLIDAVLAQLIAIGVPPELAKRECDAMLPVTVTTTTPYTNRLSLQANLKDYAWLTELYVTERNAPLGEINARLAENIVRINGTYAIPGRVALERLISSVSLSDDGSPAGVE